MVYVFSIIWTLGAYKILSYFSYRPRKHCQRGRFCVAKSESLEPNNLARSRTTANRSSPSLLYEEKDTMKGAAFYFPRKNHFIFQLSWWTMWTSTSFCLLWEILSDSMLDCVFSWPASIFQSANSCLLFNLFTHWL